MPFRIHPDRRQAIGRDEGGEGGRSKWGKPADLIDQSKEQKLESR
jgi:hypothetical protein